LVPSPPDLNRTETALHNGVAVSVLLPNLSILGVGESSHSSQADTQPSAPCLDLSASPETNAFESSSLSHSSAQGKSLIFDLRSLVSYAV